VISPGSNLRVPLNRVYWFHGEAKGLNFQLVLYGDRFWLSPESLFPFFFHSCLFRGSLDSIVNYAPNPCGACT